MQTAGQGLSRATPPPLPPLPVQRAVSSKGILPLLLVAEMTGTATVLIRLTRDSGKARDGVPRLPQDRCRARNSSDIGSSELSPLRTAARSPERDLPEARGRGIFKKS